MNSSEKNPSTTLRMLLAAAAGALLACAFPKLGVAGFAWVAPGAVLAAAMGVDGRTAFRLGFIAGCARHLVSLYWLLNIPVMKLAPMAAWLALSGYLALYQGAWVWLCWRIFPAKISGGAEPQGMLGALESIVSAGWTQRVMWSLSCAALWVTTEMIQGRFLSGFPWNFLGSSQYAMLPVIQIASVTGVYGVSFLAAWFGVSLVGAAVVVIRCSQRPRQWMGEIALPLLAAGATVAFGLQQLVAPHPTKAMLNLALVQPSIPQQMIWSPDESAKRFDQLLTLSVHALTNDLTPASNPPALLIWPEGAVPGYFRWDTNIFNAVTNLVRRHRTWLILGADDAEPRHTADDPFAYEAYNASFLVSPEGEIRATYRKRRLVIFGEYIPLARWLPFIERWTGMGSFASGTSAVPFQVQEPGFKTSVLICFEDVFARMARGDVEDDTDFLLNLTNNGWFGESAAQWQHAASSVFRAIENGLPMVRCANNGLTCWVSAQGQLREEYFPGTRDAYGPGYKRFTIPLLGGARREPTFYNRYGDVFGWSCAAWSALVAGLAFLRPGQK